MKKTIQLNADVTTLALGFGTWKLEGEECATLVEHAIKVGFRHIDTADGYGNHAYVASGIKASGIERDQLFLTTKLMRDHLTKDLVPSTVERFLEELQTDYIDLLLIHWPNSAVPISETLNAMEECKKSEKIRVIGVSNFTEHHLADALETGIEIVNNQVEVRPRFNQEQLRGYCADHNISITSYSSLQGGDLELELFAELAEKYEKSPAQIILNWNVARGLLVLTRSTKPSRIEENFASLDFTIEEEDLVRIDSLPQGSRFNDPGFSEFSY